MLTDSRLPLMPGDIENVEFQVRERRGYQRFNLEDSNLSFCAIHENGFKFYGKILDLSYTGLSISCLHNINQFHTLLMTRMRIIRESGETIHSANVKIIRITKTNNRNHFHMGLEILGKSSLLDWNLLLKTGREFNRMVSRQPSIENQSS